AAADAGMDEAGRIALTAAYAREIEVARVVGADDDPAPMRVVVPGTDDQVMRADLVVHAPGTTGVYTVLLGGLAPDGAFRIAERALLVVTNLQVARAVRRPGLSAPVDELQVRTGDANRGLAVHGCERQVGIDVERVRELLAQLGDLRFERRD